MKKFLSMWIFLLIAAASVQAQKKDFTAEDEKIQNKLSNLYTMDKFVPCIKACQDYIDNENTARSPYPYLYMSMCYYSVAQDPESFDLKKYPNLANPLRKALSFLGRFKKKDKTGDVAKENEDYLKEIRKGVLIEMSNLNDKKDYKNLQSLGRDAIKAYDKDEAMSIHVGVYMLLADARPDGERAIESSMDMLKRRKTEGNTTFSYDQADQLAQAFIAYSDYLAREGKDEKKAKAVVQFAKELLPNNEKISAQADKIGK